MCNSSLVLPGNFAFAHSFPQPLLLSLGHACLAGARRWRALWVVGFATLSNVLCYMTGVSGFWLPRAYAGPLHSSRVLLSLVVHCLHLAGPEVSLFTLQSMRKMTYLSSPFSVLGVGRLGNLT